MSFEIISTPPFEREVKKLCKKHLSLKKDIAALGVALLANQKLGTALGFECYKIRMAISSVKENLVEPE